jgi:hypothetical protein
MKPTRKTRRAVLGTIGGTTIFGAGTLAAVSPAAAQPVSGSGTGQITDVQITDVREADGNRHEDRILRGTVEGTLDGTFEQHTSGVVHESGRVVFHGKMTFTGELEDCGEGTINLRLSGKGHIPRPGFPITEGTVRVVDQAANTIAATGQGTVFQEGPDLTYDIQYICK